MGGGELAVREPVLLAGFEDAVEACGSALLPSVDAAFVEGVPIGEPDDEPLTRLVVVDGELVWEPLKAAADELSGILATGVFDEDALAVLEGVFVTGSAPDAVVVVGV
ncbi:hypothetical protein PHYPSEUDO_007832 [Phytophthora pseudosyringae]|uniref:Uncharacterized protein n=1 Tax=Phytophthora pseudosyringae TaxID=221518 RepID=A0A8T1VIJ0_9STRA|nr:hypothetical protein PHYPSEUDO_007832 [Phytophthora pseudosyringae]